MTHPHATTDQPVTLGPPERAEMSTLQMFVAAGVTGALIGAALTVAVVLWVLPGMGY